MSSEGKKSIKLNNQGEYDLSRIESNDPEVLDFVNEVVLLNSLAYLMYVSTKKGLKQSTS